MAQVPVLVDGSDSSVAGQAKSMSQRELDLMSRCAGFSTTTQSAISVRPKMMFNPDSRSPNFFLPGLMAVLLLFVTTMLTAFSVVREKERGTLEQLIVTPVKPLGLMLGKIAPYFVPGIRRDLFHPYLHALHLSCADSWQCLLAGRALYILLIR
ncbi:MAG: ABC transporter permease [Gammaproteobacteria bacterium]